MEKNKENKLLSIKDVIRTEDSRINFLRGLIRIAESDNSKTSVEESYIYSIAEILGASDYEIWQAGEYEENDDSARINFATKQEKTLFLMQALYMCWIDDDYSNAEREAIIAIGTDFGLSCAEIEATESWVKQGIDWMRTGAELLGLE